MLEADVLKQYPGERHPRLITELLNLSRRWDEIHCFDVSIEASDVENQV